MVHHTAESERATLEYGVVTPIFSETQIGATVVEILIDKKRQPKGVDLLMRVPRFTLKQPAPRRNRARNAGSPNNDRPNLC